MAQKILRAQFFTLFLLTVISFASFYLKESISDNIYSISSNTADINIFMYGVNSFLAFVGYYTGPWIFFPFFIYTILFSFVLGKRNFLTDSFNAFLLLGLGLSLTYIFYPVFIGKGLFYILSKFIGFKLMVFLFFVQFVAFMFCAFRSKFKDFVLKFYSYAKDNVKSPSITKPTEEKPRMIEKRETNSLTLMERFNTLKLSLMNFFEEKFKTSITEKITSANYKFLSPRIFRKTKKTEEVVTEVNAEENESNSEEDTEDQLKFTFMPKTNKLPNPEKKVAVPKITTQSDDLYFETVNKIKLNHDKEHVKSPSEDYFEKIIERIEGKLKEFKLDALIVNVLKGPVVDTFELELGPGIKVSRIIAHAQDLGLALYGVPLRIVYPMKGRTTMGIEVPRNPREIIYLGDILNSREFKETQDSLPICMGRDAFGEVFIVNLASMPHMLVAGATGAGKSVFINSLLVSLLIQKSPKDLKLILIDPKQLELVLYSSLPHLAMPVVTEAKIASLALQWACQEMERRYSILKEMGVRNIEGFNNKVKEADEETLSKITQYYDENDGEGYELPFLVIIVDEFADLILTKAGKEIENNICRLAAKARAAGIHLIIATQRPSVDVITGLIKSNFPTRVSFRVTTSIDSRTILNSMGAELLLGKGDMLYKAGVQTTRVHSAFVEENQIEELTNAISQFEVSYNVKAINFLENGGEEERDPYSYGSHISMGGEGLNEDELFKEAVNIVYEQKAASASMLQRRLRIGYNRAANLIEEMENKGIVGEAQGSRPRKVLGGLDELNE